MSRSLDKVSFAKHFIDCNESVILMDVTYFGRNFGVMVFQNTQGELLYWKYVKYVTVAGYYEGISCIKGRGINVKGIVCNGAYRQLNLPLDVNPILSRTFFLPELDEGFLLPVFHHFTSFPYQQPRLFDEIISYSKRSY